MKKWKLLLIGLLCVSTQLLEAQQRVLPGHVEKKYQAIIKPGATQDWIEFKSDAKLNAASVFTEAPDLLGLTERDELRLMKTNIDEAGNKHYKFAQYYNGVRIEGIEQLSHERNGKIHLINGDFIPGLNVNVIPTISAQQAIEIALAAYPAEKYMWEDEKKEAAFKAKKKDPNATLYPTPELLLVKINPKEKNTADNYVLAYRMYVFATLPSIAKYVYVNANTGEIIRDRSLEHFCNSTSVVTTFNGTKTVYTDYRTEDCGPYGDTETSYFPIDDCNPDTEIRSYFSGDYGTPSYGDDWYYCSSTNTWEGFGNYTMVMTSLWGVRQAFEYYLNTYGHESFDGSGGDIDIFNNKTYFDDDDNPNCTNANYTNIIDNLNFGSGNDCVAGTTDDYNAIDIIGHEFTHGVIEYAHFDALDYSEESGALNESFADIFGEMVEFYVEGDGSPTWLHGEDRGANRSFINPNDKGDPDTYFGDYWADLGGGDNGGVHTNSGVQNHIFYLLSEGGDGVNDYGLEYHVDAIGYDKARRIAWGAMMNYLDGSDGYIIARNAWIQSAIDYYGSCSDEVIAVGQAFQAVGVTKFTSYDLASICGTYILTGYSDATYGIENKSMLLGEFLVECSSTILSPAVVTFESANYITLHPGFEALSGCTLTAWIDECEISDYNPDDLRFAADNVEDEELSANKPTTFDIYPSPASTSVSIDFNLEKEATGNLFVTDLSGKIIANWLTATTVTAGENTLTFDVLPFASGMYVAIFQTADGIQTAKFVVQH